MTSPMYLKIPWDMKQDIIAYGLNTGHERITKCSHFNERTGEITLSGFKPDRYHSFESEEVFDYDFVYDLDNIEVDNSKRLFNKKEYKQKDYSEEVNMILPGTTVTVKNPTSIYWGYVGFIQRISGDKAAVLFDNYSPWEKMVTFPIKDLYEGGSLPK